MSEPEAVRDIRSISGQRVEVEQFADGIRLTIHDGAWSLHGIFLATEWARLTSVQPRRPDEVPA